MAFTLDLEPKIPIEFDPRWNAVLQQLKNQFGKRLSLESVLFLIGINELGKGHRAFTKEEKQDLMHIAVCKLLSFEGYYKLAGTDDEDWPHWEATTQLPLLDAREQETLLKKNIIRYFDL